MNRLLAICVAVCMLLCGCMGQVSEIKINEDLTGSISVSIGYTKEALDIISEMMEDEAEDPVSDEQMTEFTYNGVSYYGGVETDEFASISELNEIVGAYVDGENIVSMNFYELEDKSIAYAFVTGEQIEMDTSEYETSDIDEETRAQLEKSLEDFVVVFELDFPTDIEMTEGIESDAIKISGDKLSVNFVELTHELGGEPGAFVFASKGAQNVPTIADVIGFDDVTINDWFFAQVVKMAEAGLVNGKTADKFCPNDTMTKAEFITVVARIMADEETLDQYKTDAGVWWDKYYNICVAESIFTEEQFPRMHLDTAISREDMAQIAYGYLKSYEYAEEYQLDMDSVVQNIPDYEQVDEAKLYSAVHCYKDGILGGVDANGSFAPKKTLTRAEASTVLYRLVDFSKRVPSDIAVLEVQE